MSKGGKRQNAGAKRKGQYKRVAISVTLETDILTYLQQDKANTGMSCSDSINVALRAYYARRLPLDLDSAEAALNAFDLELLEDELREQEERITTQSA